MNYKCVCIISFIFSKFRSTTQNHSFNCRGDFLALVETPCFGINPSEYCAETAKENELEDKEMIAVICFLPSVQQDLRI